MTRSRSGLLLQVVFTVVLLGLLFRGFDWDRFHGLVAGTPAWLYACSFLVVVAGKVLYTWKWQLVLRAMGLRVPFSRLVQQYVIGVFFSNFLPSTVGGDWARIYYLGRERGYPDMAASVFMDRFLGLFSLTVLGTVLAWLLAPPAVIFTAGRQILTVLLGVFVVAFLVAGRVRGERVGALLPSAGRLMAQVQAGVTRFLDQTRVVIRHPATILGVMGIVLLYASLVSAVYLGFFRASTDVDPSFWPILAAVMIISVLSNVPVTINGIGLREQLHFLFFAALGLPKEVSVSLSLLMFVHVLVISLAGCWLWLRWKPVEVQAPR